MLQRCSDVRIRHHPLCADLVQCEETLAVIRCLLLRYILVIYVGERIGNDLLPRHIKDWILHERHLHAGFSLAWQCKVGFEELRMACEHEPMRWKFCVRL